MDKLPDFMIVDNIVEITKNIGKDGVAGFVNAVLNKVALREFKMPEEGEDGFLPIKYSKPEWFVKKLQAEYTEDEVLQILSEPPAETEHYRVNLAKTNLNAVATALGDMQVKCECHEPNRILVKATRDMKTLNRIGHVTAQSPSSMLVVEGMGMFDGAKVLDLCSAPGGKAVYIAEKNPNGLVVACDTHEHRTELITAYAKRMDVNIDVKVNDATVFNSEWENAFDFVLVDAPCSCFGTSRKHADVFLQRKPEDIDSLSELQKSIVDVAKRYVKEGGRLVYSTCTIFKQENEDIADYVLTDENFSLEKLDIPYENNGTYKILPKGEWDGFFIAKFVKK